MENRIDEAVDVFSEVYAENPDYLQNTFLYGRSLYYSDRIDEAAVLWNDIYAENPYYTDNTLELIRYHMEAGNYDIAEEMIRNALKWNSADPALLLLLSRIYSENGDYEAALNFLVQSGNSLEKMVEIPLEYALLMQRYGFIEEAAHSVDKAIFMVNDKNPILPALRALKKRLINEIEE